MLYCCVC